jgi:kumamolisin
VLAVLGLTNYAPFVSHAVHEDTKVTVKTAKTSVGTPGDYLPSAFAKTYHLTAIADKADGAGDTIGIVTLATVDPTAPAYFWKNVAKIRATSRTLKAVNVDGGSGKPSDAAGSGETDIDVEQSGALAPGANVILYQAPNTDPGFIDAFFYAASANKADSLSTSWGESETVVAAAVAAGQETAAYEAAFDEALLELSDQGQSVFDAAGDAGAYDDSDELGTTELSVDTPADSPYATASGGTTLPFNFTVKGSKASVKVSVAKQRAWGWDYLWTALAKATGISYPTTVVANAAGGGGGFSTVESEPSYQALVSGTSSYTGVQYLTPDDPKVVVPGTDFTEPTNWKITNKPKTVTGSGSGRAVPDLSANADPYSGYLLYEPSAVAAGSPALEGGWGGTSFVAPQFNGSAALIDSSLGHRTGFWNPDLYWAATHANSPFTTMNTAGTSNDNLFYTGTPGTVYNPATGLGVPNLGAVRNLFAS